MGGSHGKNTPGFREQREHSKKVGDIQKRRREASYKLRLLFLGLGESGTSTILKQCVDIFGRGFPESARISYKKTIFKTVITTMKTLVAQCELRSGLAASKDAILELKDDESVTEEVGRHIIALWADRAIQSAFENTKERLANSADWFFDRIETIQEQSYIPSNEDVLRTRDTPKGIVEEEFGIDGSDFQVFDVGGQRNERKKWLPCFERVNGVIFVASLNTYDHLVDGTSQLHHSLDLFEDIINLRWFRDTSIFIFLTFRDRFFEKLQKVPLNVCFPEYKGENNYEEALPYVQSQFTGRCRERERLIFVHSVCGIDKVNMKAVMNNVKECVVPMNLISSGLLGESELRKRAKKEMEFVRARNEAREYYLV